MKAFVMKKIGSIGFMDKPVPAPGPLDALIRPTKGLVCTSDIHTVHGAVGERTNLTMGHEAVGIVEQVGELVQHFKPGERVAVGAITPDWGSLAAQAGHSSQSGGALGGWKFANEKDGVFAEFFLVNEADANMAHIPESVPDEMAVYIADMMSTGFMAAENAKIPSGGTVAVFAQGPVGLMATAAARLLGAGLIIAVESMPRRQELARHFGADQVVDFTKVDAVRAILDLTDGEGVDAAIEALGASAVLANCVRVTKPGGLISNAGYHGQGDFVSIPRVEWGVGMAEKDIVTGLCPGGRLRLQRLLRLLENGRLDPTPLTTHTFTFPDLERAFQLMESKEEGIIKPLIDFTA
jgi:threonine dehydrogenase-like Zn-dependent dehydrogenase